MRISGCLWKGVVSWQRGDSKVFSFGKGSKKAVQQTSWRTWNISSSIMQLWSCTSEGIRIFIIRGEVVVVVVAWARKLGDGEAS